MSLKLNSTGGGSVTLDSGSTPNNVTITLPGTNGTMATLASVANNGVVYVNSTGQPTSGSGLTFDGTTLNFGGTAQRITGDFGNATLTNRVLFQNSILNGTTSVGIIPNGTSAAANVAVFNSSDPLNSSIATLDISTFSVILNSTKVGTGAFLPLVFWTSNTERMRIDTSGNVGIGTSSPTQALTVNGAVGYNAPVTTTSATYSVATTDNWIICNRAGTVTLTLPTASSFAGRILTVKTVQAQTVVSASSNVVTIGSTTAGTAILAATAGKFATLVSDGTNWIIMQAN